MYPRNTASHKFVTCFSIKCVLMNIAFEFVIAFLKALNLILLQLQYIVYIAFLTVKMLTFY